MKNKYWIFIVSFFLIHCAGEKINVKLNKAVPAAASDHFTVGVDKTDITPPPGYPMGGFGFAGRYARGWWTR